MRTRATGFVYLLFAAAQLPAVGIAQDAPDQAQELPAPGPNSLNLDAPNPDSAVDVLGIVRRSVERDAQNYELLQRYTFTEVDTEKRYKKDGSLEHTESKTYEVRMLVGRPYEQLVARDGVPLSERDAHKEQEKLDKEFRKRSKDPEKEHAKYQEDRAEQREFLEEVPGAFDFTLLGVEAVNGRPAWKIFAEPREDFKPQHSRADTLKKVRGTFWIDQTDLEWVRMDLEVTDTISWGWFVLRIDPGGTIRFEQTRVNGEIWLPEQINIRADARVALLKKIRAEINIAYRDYRKFETESQLIGAEALAAPE